MTTCQQQISCFEDFYTQNGAAHFGVQTFYCKIARPKDNLAKRLFSENILFLDEFIEKLAKSAEKWLEITWNFRNKLINIIIECGANTRCKYKNTSF